MERFQRTAYLNKVSSVRRELWGWVAVYRGQLANEFNIHSPAAIARAEARADWLEGIAVDLERIEGALGYPPPAAS